SERVSARGGGSGTASSPFNSTTGSLLSASWPSILWPDADNAHHDVLASPQLPRPESPPSLPQEILDWLCTCHRAGLDSSSSENTLVDEEDDEGNVPLPALEERGVVPTIKIQRTISDPHRSFNDATRPGRLSPPPTQLFTVTKERHTPAQSVTPSLRMQSNSPEPYSSPATIAMSPLRAIKSEILVYSRDNNAGGPRLDQRSRSPTCTLQPWDASSNRANVTSCNDTSDGITGSFSQVPAGRFSMQEWRPFRRQAGPAGPLTRIDETSVGQHWTGLTPPTIGQTAAATKNGAEVSNEAEGAAELASDTLLWTTTATANLPYPRPTTVPSTGPLLSPAEPPSASGPAPGRSTAPVRFTARKKHACPFPGCGRTFPRQYNLQSHLFCHTKERPQRCEACGAAFARRHDLRRHVHALHDPTRAHGCTRCTTSFPTAALLKKHRAATGHLDTASRCPVVEGKDVIVVDSEIDR
ncbi:hypothetical protein HK405_012394, partial [Cladochytrium tenue]